MSEACPLRTVWGTGVLPLQEHDPLGAATAVLVLAPALTAVPVRPPDPFEVVDLEDDQDDAPDEDLGPAHARAASPDRLVPVNGPDGSLTAGAHEIERRREALC